jgi:hypothetical protein
MPSNTRTVHHRVYGLCAAAPDSVVHRRNAQLQRGQAEAEHSADRDGHNSGAGVAECVLTLVLLSAC